MTPCATIAPSPGRNRNTRPALRGKQLSAIERRILESAQYLEPKDREYLSELLLYGEASTTPRPLPHRKGYTP